ncbi:MAG: TolC family protein, partial [Bacteroidota bacterium]|nr:TolC family protein [Bacteroidota bacterium]
MVAGALMQPLGIEAQSLPEVWTIQQCLEYAKAHNIQVNSLRLTTQSNEQDFLLSKAARDPNLSGSFVPDFTHSKVRGTFGGIQSQSDFQNAYSAGSSVVLYNGGYLRNDLKQKQLQLQASKFDLQAEENSITLQITQAYLSILVAKENIIYLQDLVVTSQAQLAHGQILFKAGSIALKDLVQLQSQLATDKYNLVTAQNNLRQTSLNLKQLLQLPSGYQIQVVQPDTVIQVTAVTPLEEVQKMALTQRPEVQSSSLAIQMARLDLSKAMAGSKPELTASGSLSTGYSSVGSGHYIRQLDNNFYQRIGLTLSIPIFNNRIVKTNIEKSKIAIQQSELNLKNTTTLLSQAVEQAYLDVLNAQAQYEASVVQLDANKENYRIATEQLRLGAVSTVDYLIQKNLYVQALQEYIQAKYNALLTVKIYDFYKGQPVNL